MMSDLSKVACYNPKYSVNSHNVLNSLSKHMLVDGFDFILNLEDSKEGYFVDKITGKKYYDFFSFFGSIPINMNHAKLNTPEFINYLGACSLTKPSNSDIYTEQMATFVNTFFQVAIPEYFKYIFMIDGGALAVENALKVAFDWKVRKNFKKGHTKEIGSKIIHFEQAFHGRSGYTMSLTNTDPVKVKYFPKYDWPRIINPKLQFPINEENLDRTIELEKLAIEQINTALKNYTDDIAAIIIEPIQCEGGDNHFRNEFLMELRRIADENDILLIFDEVQTGLGLTGTMWAHEQMNVKPDIMVFGKKTQICGIVVTDRIDDIDDHVFKTSSRINSTWGGNLTDMVRSTRLLEIIEEDNLLNNVVTVGDYLKSKIEDLRDEYPSMIANPRGRGLLRAFSLTTTELRNEFRQKCYENGLIILGCGDRSIRFRPTLDSTTENIDSGFNIIESVLKSLR